MGGCEGGVGNGRGVRVECGGNGRSVRVGWGMGGV